MMRPESGRARRILAVVALAVGCAGLLACGTLDKPTDPQPAPTSSSSAGSGGDPKSQPVLGAPAPKPTPTPDPNTTPSPSPSPSPSPTGQEGEAACGDPLPGPLAKVNMNVYMPGSDNWILDSTPIVGPDPAYCKKIGFTDGRSMCPVRPEGNPQRSACELYVVGRAKDTGQPGPTWYLDGHLCTGKASGCENSGSNQYMLSSYRGGVFQACGNVNDVCGELVVTR
ncbi:MAG TPA: hypothetical protein VMX54_20050 [Vicinamibacteria bacterium]|nr:hypothetical protein [Vicinamibacteria bacterium]